MQEKATQQSDHMMIRGRFGDSLTPVMEAINASIGFDKRMAEQDIAGSLVHSDMLARQGIISLQDRDSIHNALTFIRAEIAEGAFEFSTALEDIHMNVEARAKVLVGESAGRLHTARSRNDQVATDFRLWVRDAHDRANSLLLQLMGALLSQAEQHVNTLLPGYTHLQTAQPVIFGHHMLAYLEMFSRDLGRFTDSRQRMNECPLGAAALAGTSFPIDRHYTSERLGFGTPMRNSLDAVSDRDFAIEYVAAAATCMVHLSRLAEEITLWMSPQFDFIRLSDNWTTGSSIMPQKKNPDAAELVRGKTGRVTGALVALLTLMKGLPLTFSKDMQEDKENLFDAADTLELCLKAMTGMLADLQANTETMEKAASSGFSTATDLADWLVRFLGLPFRDAHHATGRIVRLAESKRCSLEELPLADMQQVESRITEAVYDVLSSRSSVNSRVSFGGTAPIRVIEQVAWWKNRLAQLTMH